MQKPSLAKLLVPITILACAGVAAADDAKTAFKRGQTALKAGRVHDACQDFEASIQMEAKIETKLALASCYEQDGKLVAAMKLYRELAETDTNAARKKTSAAKATKLEAKAPKLRFAINPRPDGLVIKVDGVEVPNTGDVPVDAGPHEVVVTAPGYEGHASAPVDKDRGVVDVIVRLESTAPPAPPPAPPVADVKPPVTTGSPGAPEDETETDDTAPAPMPVNESPNGSSNRGRNGVIVGAVGVASLVGAGVFFALSSSKFDDRDALCPNRQQCASAADADKANSLRDDARTLRGTSIGLGIGGAVLVGAGAYLFFTRPKSSGVAFDVGRDSATFVFTGRF